MVPIQIIRDYLIDNEEGMKLLLPWFLNLVMQVEALEQAGAEHYERTETRKGYRNGYKERSLKTRVGKLTLKKPQFRDIPFETQVFDRYARVERALMNAIAESYLQGVSTRRVQEIVSHLGIDQIFPSSVSRIAKELDEKVEEFLKRPIEQEIPYLFVEASYFKVRDGVRYVTKAFLAVTVIRSDGYREILGARIADGEDKLFWSSFFDELKSRSLKGVHLIISDGHKGIQKAVESSFPGSIWQMCRVHFIRAVLRNIPKKHHRAIADKLKESLEDEQKLQDLAHELDKMRYSQAASTIERFLPGLMNFKAFPKSHWKRIRTTNGLERINKELKRRTRVVGAFPNDDSFLRLAVSILIDINEEWVTGKRYLSMDEE
jgi:transposase-like protein